jgi:hypothetical protein
MLKGILAHAGPPLWSTSALDSVDQANSCRTIGLYLAEHVDGLQIGTFQLF